MGELPFVGAGRVGVVDRLQGELDAVVDGGRPRLVVVEAPSGWGKSRLVQELYRRMAASQPEPRFWPASIVDAVGGGGRQLAPQQRRKRMFPEVFTPEPGSVPHWLWWGISATARKSGTAVDALAGDLHQIEVHADALERRWRQVTGRKERLGQLLRGEQSVALGEAASQELLSVGLEKLVEASVPGLGLMWCAARIAHQQHDRWRQGKQEAAAVDLGVGVREDVVASVASSLGYLASAGIPVVVAVEDVHEADASLVELLVRTVAEGRGPVLVVATAWPGFLDDENCAANRLITDIPAPARVRLHISGAGHGQVEPLDELTVDERMALVGELLPDAPQAGCRALARRYANPLLLELVCTSSRVAELAEDNELTDVEVARLPADLDDVYRDMWRSLPEKLREAVMLAVLAAPSTIGGLFEDRTWDVGLTASGWAGLERFAEQARELPRLLGETGDAYAWVRAVDRWLQACHEPSQHDIARGFAIERHTERTRRRFYQSLADAIDLDDQQLTPTQRRARAQLLTALAAEGFIDWTPHVIDAADLLLDEAAEAHDVDSLHTVIKLGAAIPATDDERELRRRSHVAQAHGHLGQLHQAIEQFTVLLDDRIRVSGEDHPDTLTARGALAYWLGQAGRGEEAIGRFTALLVDQTRLLGEDHRDTLLTRHNLVTWLGQRLPRQELLDRYAELRDDQVRALGPDDPLTMATRRNLAASLGDDGRATEAVEQLTEVLQDCARVLGGDHPDTLTARRTLASWLGEAGRVEEAVEQLGVLLEDGTRVLGADHPDTLTIRRALAFWLDEVGRTPEVVDHLRLLLDDCTRVLGRDHPDTLATRQDLLSAFDHAGQVPEAVEQLAELVDARSRIAGRDHPDTLATREDLAAFLGRVGRTEEAIGQLASVVDVRARVLGAAHPDTLATRRELASLHGEAGRVQQAVWDLTDLLDDSTRELGGDHHVTRGTRRQLARWVAASGDADRAIGELTRLIDDSVRVQGEDSAETTIARRQLAAVLGEVGRVQEAVEQFTAVVATHTRRFGVDDLRVLVTRRQFASFLGKLGRRQEACAYLTSLLDDHRRVLGDGHRLTCAVRSELAQLEHGGR